MRIINKQTMYIKHLRKMMIGEKRMLQSEFSKLLGYSTNYISTLESGKRKMSFKCALKYSRATGIDPFVILENSTEK